MTYPRNPPEVNSAEMRSGPGTESIQEAAAAYDRLAEQLNTAAEEVSSLTVELTGRTWQGSAAATMAAEAASCAKGLHAHATQASLTAAQINAIVHAFEAAQAATVPLEVVTANLEEREQLAASNILDQNAALIAINSDQYAEMWAQDAGAIANYHYAVNAAYEVLPPEIIPYQGPLLQLAHGPAPLLAAAAAWGEVLAEPPGPEGG